MREVTVISSCGLPPISTASVNCRNCQRACGALTIIWLDPLRVCRQAHTASQAVTRNTVHWHALASLAMACRYWQGSATALRATMVSPCGQLCMPVASRNRPPQLPPFLSLSPCPLPARARSFRLLQIRRLFSFRLTGTVLCIEVPGYLSTQIVVVVVHLLS